MTDKDVMKRIEALNEERQTLFDKGADRSAAEQERLEAVEVELDQQWDLLRQRRAKEEFGEDPDQTELRGPDTVENYEQ